MLHGYFLEISYGKEDPRNMEMITEADNETRAILSAWPRIPSGHQISILYDRKAGYSGLVMERTPQRLVPRGVIQATPLRA
jgi:hypothetical protein